MNCLAVGKNTIEEVEFLNDRGNNKTTVLRRYKAEDL